MKIVSALLLCSLLGFVSSQDEDIPTDQSENVRSLQYAQEIRWNISDPEFAYTDLQFMLEWQTSDYIQDRYVDWRIYDGFDCKDGSNDITDEVSNFQQNDVYFQNLGMQPDASTPPNSGLGYRDFRLFLAVQPTVAQAPIFYYIDDGGGLKARMDFCIRFSLYNEDPDEPNSVEVNFQETLVAFYADLTDGFNVTDVSVTNKNKIEKDAYVACEIEAYECDDDNLPLENPGYLRNQGREVRVCVTLTEESKAQGLYLDRIIWFYFIRTHEDGDIVRQNSIIPDSLPALSGLTDYDCMRGVDICPFDTILRADFFAWSGLGYVRGIGEGLCQFGGSPYLVEDVPKVIGDRVGWQYHVHAVSYAKAVRIFGFPIGATVAYTDTDQSSVSLVIDSEDYVLLLEAPNDARLRNSLDTPQVTAPLHSDEDFDLSILVRTTAETDHLYLERVAVLAVADPPQVSASEILVLQEDGDPILLQVDPDRSADEDDSEVLSVRITVPAGADGLGSVGTMVQTSTSPENISVGGAGTSVMRVEATGPDPATREATLDAYLSGSIAFRPRDHWAGVLTGEEGIKVAAVSTERSGQVEPSNSAEEGTLGDLDTRIEEAITYVDVTVIPVNDIPYLTNTQTIVQENKLDSDFDRNLVVPIGLELGLKCDDMDGSQSLEADLTGFPTNTIDISFGRSRPGVNVTVDIPTGTVTIAGDNVVDVLEVLESLSITLAHDDDKNFLIEIDGISADRNELYEVSDSFSLEHQVIVQAVADTPTLDVGATLKTLSSEGSTLSPYPVEIGLNDVDGSETYQGREVTIDFSTPTGISTGADPVFNFGTSTGVTESSSSGPAPGSGTITLTGDGTALETAMASLMIRPGDHNGEDITVTVTVTSFESNPSELGPNEVAVPIVTSVDTFKVPVDPVIQGNPTISVPIPSPAGPEDTRISLGLVRVDLDGIEDTDGSEIYYLEILKSSIRAGTKFYVDGTRLSGTSVGDWRRFPNVGSNFEVKPPPNFSGRMQLSLRGHNIDYTMSGNATATTDPVFVDIAVSPVADDFTDPAESTLGVEDLGPVPFGTTLATTGLQPIDNGTGRGNNPESETLSRISFVVPADTSSLEYTISGDHAPFESGTFAGIGSAEVTFDLATRTYTLTSTTITGADYVGNLTATELEQAEADIRKTLATFQVEIGPEHTDLNGAITVTATTLDVNIQEFDTRDETFTHNIIIQAVADAGGIFTHGTNIVDEDGSNIPLKIVVTRSADEDNSETLSVRIKLPVDRFGPIGTIVGNAPSGVFLDGEGNGQYLITANGTTPIEREEQLNSFVSLGDLAFDPRANFAGNATIQVDLISTERATGNEVADGELYGGSDNDAKIETVTSYIDISVRPVADDPIIALEDSLNAKANGVGGEDTKIYVPVSITLSDPDGSETYVIQIYDRSVPPGSAIFGEDLENAIPKAGGIYLLEPADVEALRILPPLHYSSPLQGNIVLETNVVVTDSVDGFVSSSEVQKNITVRVLQVSDPPNNRSVHVVGFEDTAYPIGQYVGDLAGALVDTDGSETLSLVVGGLPEGAVAMTENQAGISYIGGGEWQIEEAMVPSLTITPRANYAGEDPYSTLIFRAVSQEIEGDQSSTDWTITFDVYPIADGFSRWEPSVTVTEEENEAGLGVSLSNTGDYTLADPDSEYVLKFYFDLSNVIADAGIGVRLQQLTDNANADIDTLISSNYLEGIFSYDSTSKVITVEPENIGGIRLSGELFLDSNQDFTIPISALVEDSAVIDNEVVTHDITQQGTFTVKLKGTADIPMVFADSISGNCKFPTNLGGDVTDTDVALGRKPSESLYFIVSLVSRGMLPGFSFVDINDEVIGINGGSDTWIFSQEEVQNTAASGGLFFTTRQAVVDMPTRERKLEDTTPSAESTSEPSPEPTMSPSSMPTVTAAEFTIMAVVNENDGDMATSSTSFSVNFWNQNAVEGVCPGVISPLPPLVGIGTHQGIEDTPIQLNITASPAPGDPMDPTVLVVISQWPEGMEFEGNFVINHATGSYVAIADDVNGGGLIVTPPHDFSGNLTITIEVIAVNANYVSAMSGLQNVTIHFDPVADDAVISISNLDGRENEVTSLPLSVAVSDSDESEILGPFVYVQVCANAQLNGDYPVVQSDDVDASVDGVAVDGYHRLQVDTNTFSQGYNLTMVQDAYWHGSCPVSVVAQTVEVYDDVNDEDKSKATQATFNVYIAAVANAPVITGPDRIVGPEDSQIPIPGLSAASVDTVVDNGKETLSTIFTEVPEGTLFNHGVNGGNGIWTIPVDQLGNLAIQPPQHYAGDFTVTYTVVTKELDGGDEASTSLQIAVEVTPVADVFEWLAQNVQLEAGGTSPLRLNIRMDDTRGTLPGELPEELITVILSSVPAELTISSTRGGSLNFDSQSGDWTFTGTEYQSNGLTISGLASIGQYTISARAFTIDRDSVLDTPKEENFVTYVNAPGTTSSRRGLQDLDLSVDGVFDAGVQGIRHCDSDVNLLWDSSDASFYLPSLSIEEQLHTTVKFLLSSARAPSVNWLAVLFPNAPAGENSCPVPVAGNEVTFTANCNDYLARAYIYINVNDAPADQIDAYVPLNCEVPDQEGGKTVVYAIDLPCSACSGAAPGAGEDPNRERKLDQAVAMDGSSHHVPHESVSPVISNKSDDLYFLEEVAASLPGPRRNLILRSLYEPRRKMEEAAGGEGLNIANRIEVEFLAVGDEPEEGSGANSLARGLFSMALAIVVSAIVLLC